MKKIFYPVIHVETLDQAIQNTKIAYDAGTDGVFLINHSINHEILLRVHEEVFSRFGKNLDDYRGEDQFKIGVNFLDLTPLEVIPYLNNSIPMFWTDNALIDDSFHQDGAIEVKLALKESGWQGQYFGGVAFKYQKPVVDVERVAEVASAFVDVIVTTGEATGKSAPVEKVKRMRNYIGKAPLALASGITAENVASYKDYVDIFLVATSISKDFLNLDPVKINNLIKQIRIM